MNKFIKNKVFIQFLNYLVNEQSNKQMKKQAVSLFFFIFVLLAYAYNVLKQF